MRRVPILYLGILTAVVAFSVGGSGDEATRAATTPSLMDLLCDPGARREVMNEGLIAVADKGLRIEVAPGKEWALAAATHVQLPFDAERIHLSIGQLSPGARAIIKLVGDFDGSGRAKTVLPLEPMAHAGEWQQDLDPRIAFHLREPVQQIQLGLEGPTGAFVTFKGIEFTTPPDADRKRNRPRPADPPVSHGNQRSIACIEMMPNLPEPYHMKDWRALAQAYDRFVFDFQAQGEYLPFVWIDDSRVNIDGPTFGLPSYAGDLRQGSGKGSAEGVTCLGAVLGATLAGIDKRRQDHDYVLMCEAWYNRRNGSNLVLNAMDQETGGSFWYEIWPHLVFYALVDRYPGVSSMRDILRITADRWYQAYLAMGGANRNANFNHTAFNFKTQQPVDNGKWREPDAAAGVAWIEYMAWTQFHETKYLEAADGALRFLDAFPTNPFYEVLLPYGAYLAARMNAELGRTYDVHKLLNRCFGVSDCRGGWGVIVGRWGDYDCDGLVGSIDDRCGYAFAMNSFVQASALTPLVRYDARYARAIGKWMTNLANSARLFYPDALPAEQQSSAFWHGDPDNLIAYEGLRHRWEGKEPYATGDPIAMKWGPATDRGLYGSSYVGCLGALVRTTNVERILQLDCLATDYFHGPAFPTYLYFNPFGKPRTIEVDVGPDMSDLYDAMLHRFVKRGVKDKGVFDIAPDAAALIVVTPAGATVAREGRLLRAGGVIIDYACE